MQTGESCQMGLHQARGRGRAHRMREKFVLQNHPPAAYLCLLTSLEPGSRLTISLVRNRPLAHRNHALESISSFTRAVSNGTPYSTTGPRSRGSTMALALTPFRLRAGGRKRQARERDGGRVAVAGGKSMYTRGTGGLQTARKQLQARSSLGRWGLPVMATFGEVRQ